MDKKIIRTKSFLKAYQKRVAPNDSLEKQFANRLAKFANGNRGHPVNDHPLKGGLNGYRSFSVTGDVRVIYRETETAYIFKDIGTHNQVY